MRLNILYLAVLGLVLSHPAYATEGHQMDYKCILFVEAGDSYIRLFGSDWQRVFQSNSNMTFYDKQGRLTRSPEKLVVGQSLIIPAGTYLSQRALERLSRYEKIKDRALETIRQAEACIGQPSRSKSEVYQQGLKLLLKAKEAAKGLTFGFGNYIEASRLAQEAIRCFRIDTNLEKANHDIAQLQERVQRERIEAKKEIKTVYNKRMVPVGGLIVLLVMFLWIMHRRNRKERIKGINAWLSRHQEQVKRLERAIG